MKLFVSETDFERKWFQRDRIFLSENFRQGHVIHCHKSNLVYTVVFPQFLIFLQNNSPQTSVLIFFTSRYYYFFEKLKIVEKQQCKLNCSYGKVSRIQFCIKNYIRMSLLENSLFIFFTWLWIKKKLKTKVEFAHFGNMTSHLLIFYIFFYSLLTLNYWITQEYCISWQGTTINIYRGYTENLWHLPLTCLGTEFINFTLYDKVKKSKIMSMEAELSSSGAACKTRNN